MPTPLAGLDPIAFVVTQDPERAKAFYRDTLGLSFLSEDPFAIVFDLNGIMLRVSIAQQHTPAKHTVLGWKVTDIAATAKALQAAGVKFEHYGFPGQDEQGIWSAPGGAKVAWFKDADGNVLSISQH